MPLFLIERQFGEQLQLNREGVAETQTVNAETGVEWVYSFLSADKKKTYCLYEAPSAAAIRESAERLGIPADVIIEVNQVRPQDYA